MLYTLKEPCPECPFRDDIKPYLNADRAEEICNADSFACHKTTQSDSEDEEGEMLVTDKSQMCAGYLILREKMGQPSQMMRIAERIGLYDRRKLKMDSPVFEDADEMVFAQED